MATVNKLSDYLGTLLTTKLIDDGRDFSKVNGSIGRWQFKSNARRRKNGQNKWDDKRHHGRNNPPRRDPSIRHRISWELEKSLPRFVGGGYGHIL